MKPELRPRIGARVASLRCPILRPDVPSLEQGWWSASNYRFQNDEHLALPAASSQREARGPTWPPTGKARGTQDPVGQGDRGIPEGCSSPRICRESPLAWRDRLRRDREGSAWDPTSGASGEQGGQLRSPGRVLAAHPGAAGLGQAHPGPPCILRGGGAPCYLRRPGWTPCFQGS